MLRESMSPTVLQLKRNQQILTELVRVYIETGEPVSSRSGARAYGGGVSFLCGAGHGAGDGEPGRPAVDPAGAGSSTDSGSGDGAGQPGAGGGFARARDIYFPAAGERGGGAYSISTAAGWARAGGADFGGK